MPVTWRQTKAGCLGRCWTTAALVKSIVVASAFSNVGHKLRGGWSIWKSRLLGRAAMQFIRRHSRPRPGAAPPIGGCFVARRANVGPRSDEASFPDISTSMHCQDAHPLSPLFDVPPLLCQVYSCIEAGVFGPASDFRPILDSLQHGNDYYLLAHDFPSYLEAQVSSNPSALWAWLGSDSSMPKLLSKCTCTSCQACRNLHHQARLT
jgi:hypothetical protein